MRILGIETSCDETAAAVVVDQRVVSNVVYSQIALHAEYGGVVPELASRAHIVHILPVVRSALQEANLDLGQMAGIAVTVGPGLLGALLTGLSTAKGLAMAVGCPLIGIHHLEGHLLSSFLDPQADPPMTFPFVALLVSGGHTLLVLVESYGQYRILGQSRDDAAGEAFDKGAMLMGLGYPGGIAISQCAMAGNPGYHAFPMARLDKDSLDFSFSGLKTSLRTLLHQQPNLLSDPVRLADIAASYQEAIVEILVRKALLACQRTQCLRLVVAGGVAANARLRQLLMVRSPAQGIRPYFPPMSLCTDNGAMIAYAGVRRLSAGYVNGWSLDAHPRWSLAEIERIY